MVCHLTCLCDFIVCYPSLSLSHITCAYARQCGKNEGYQNCEIIGIENKELAVTVKWLDENGEGPIESYNLNTVAKHVPEDWQHSAIINIDNYWQVRETPFLFTCVCSL